MVGAAERPPLAVRFVVSQNLPVSVTRLTATTASALARLGIPTTVVFPLVDWLDYKLLRIAWGRVGEKAAWMLRLLRELAWNLAFRRAWDGFRHYRADPRIHTVRYLLTPPAPPRGTREVTIVQHPYIIPHLLRSVTDHRAPIVSVVYSNYELDLQSPIPEQAAWKRHCIAVERMLNVPRIAASERAKQAAERLGIRVDRVINVGTDLGLFRLPASRMPRPFLTVTLFCATSPQKGQRIGSEAMRRLRVAGNTSIRLCSLGEVFPEGRELFDHNYGYLHGEAYVRAIQETDIFVYPSLSDGFPAPPLEAMACGCAVVTTAVEGLTEYAVDGENCLLCEPGDAKALLNALLRLIDDESLRVRLQHAGPKTAHAYRIEEKARELVAFCQELLDGEQQDARVLIAHSAVS